jgi:hypothetical protein
MTVASMNRELHARYAEALRELKGRWQPLDGDSKPMLIAVPPSYAHAAVNLLVVGQEAGGWAEAVAWPGITAGALMRVYTDFALGHHQTSTPFWQGARSVFAGLKCRVGP